MHISKRVVCDKNNHFTTFLLSVEWPVDRMKKEVRLMNRKYGTVIFVCNRINYVFHTCSKEDELFWSEFDCHYTALRGGGIECDHCNIKIKKRVKKR